MVILRTFLFVKTNKILIPFLFFYIGSYLLFHLLNWLKPGLIVSSATGIWDVFTQRTYFNGPIWFLLCLFWTNIMFCVISLNINGKYKKYWRLLAVILISTGGLVLSYHNIFLPMMLDNAMTALFFFYIGYELKQTTLLYPNRFDKWNVPIALGFYAISLVIYLLFDNPRFELTYNRIHGNPVMAYIISVTSVMSILFLCKAVGRLPFISYFGRYSIIPLCVHHLIYRPVALFINILIPSISKLDIPYINPEGLLTAIITILICWACIPLCRKYLPYVTAQKDLIKLKAS